MYHSKKIKTWLLLSIACIIAMIIIGGYTRLTDSGLSIVEWRPVTGVLPPLSNFEWTLEFAKYQKSPEYQKINIGFSLNEFKQIYYVEYFHRLIGRIFALVFILPFAYFLHKKYLTKEQIRTQFIAALLILSQGFMGWYMVKSGLVSNPHVSHFRLASHLIIACILLNILAWEYLSIEPLYIKNAHSKYPNFAIRTLISTEKHSFFVLFNIYIQIFSGALVAGLHAGLVYNSFPLMDGKFIPNEISDSSSIFDIFTSPGSIQFIHRIIAYFLLVNVLFFCYRLVILFKEEKILIHAVYLLLSLMFLQFALGVSTLLLVVPLSFALLHQLCGILLLMTSIYVLHSIRSIKESMNARL
jgi:cytochrome c oxidase assembly protein subunit 15